MLDPRVRTLRFILFAFVAFVASLCARDDRTRVSLLLATGFGWWKGCGCCQAGLGCTVCTGTTQTLTVQYDLAGVVEGTCGSCASLNTSYILDWVNSGTKCGYQDLPGAACGVFELNFFWGAGGNNAYVGDVFTTQVVRFDGTAGATQDCSAVPAQLTYFSMVGGSAIHCDFTAATVDITPL